MHNRFLCSTYSLSSPQAPYTSSYSLSFSQHISTQIRSVPSTPELFPRYPLHTQQRLGITRSNQSQVSKIICPNSSAGLPATHTFLFLTLKPFRVQFFCVFQPSIMHSKLSLIFTSFHSPPSYPMWGFLSHLYLLYLTGFNPYTSL